MEILHRRTAAVLAGERRRGDSAGRDCGTAAGSAAQGQEPGAGRLLCSCSASSVWKAQSRAPPPAAGQLDPREEVSGDKKNADPGRSRAKVGQTGGTRVHPCGGPPRRTW
eukprot:1187118-Prorocentrum_minimum.AAC.1